jgi:hypothetical protein
VKDQQDYCLKRHLLLCPFFLQAAAGRSLYGESDNCRRHSRVNQFRPACAREALRAHDVMVVCTFHCVLRSSPRAAITSENVVNIG